jgi:hypothetical protein
MNQKERPCPVFTENGARFYRDHHAIVRDVARIARQCTDGFKEFHHSEFMRLACNALSAISPTPTEASDLEVVYKIRAGGYGGPGCVKDEWTSSLDDDEACALIATIRADERRNAAEKIRALAYEGKGMTSYGADQYNEALGDAETAILGETTP